jgi:hypothetical protein
MAKFLALDESDSIVGNLTRFLDTTYISTYKNLASYNKDIPLIFRGMTQRKTVALCEKQNRDYFYIDTGYIGNMQRYKDWHRVVKNGMQHVNVNYDMPEDRFRTISASKSYLNFPGWKKGGRAILVVTPSEKPCKFYGINRDKFVEETISTLKKFTDRPIIIRDKAIRRKRVGSGSIYNQLDTEDIFAVVTYNSIAATEAVGYGIPAFTLAPNAADPFCLKDLSKIESPLYEDPHKVQKWQHWLAYCQYHPKELSNGTAMRLIEEYDLK